MSVSQSLFMEMAFIIFLQVQAQVFWLIINMIGLLIYFASVCGLIMQIKYYFSVKIILFAILNRGHYLAV